MISWSYYGLKSVTFLFGDAKWIEYTYKFIFCLVVVIGASMNLGAVVGFSDAMIFAMCFPNVFGMIILSPGIRKDLFSFLERIKSGEIKSYK